MKPANATPGLAGRVQDLEATDVSTTGLCIGVKLEGGRRAVRLIATRQGDLAAKLTACNACFGADFQRKLKPLCKRTAPDNAVRHHEKLFGP